MNFKNYSNTLVKLLILYIIIFNNNINAQYVDSPYRFQYKQVIVPASLTAIGIAINSNDPNSIKNKIKNFRNEKYPTFHTKVDDYLIFAPTIVAFGMELTPYKSRTNIYDKVAIYAKSQLINFGITTSLKYAIGQTRPDNSNNLSMPSGHTSQAFSTATFLAMEYQSSIPWMPYLAYGMATSVGVLRIMNNKHYLSDVLVGAAVGILSTKIAYWTHQYKWKTYFVKEKEISTLKP